MLHALLGALAAACGCLALAAPPNAPIGPLLALAADPATAGDPQLRPVQGGRAVGPGTRLMYYASSASVRGSLVQAQWKDDCDPSVEDCWIDPQTGARVANVEVPTAAGDGYAQVDVLYLDDQVCVVRVTNHLRDLTTGAVIGTGATGVVSRDGCADYWVPPARLGDVLGVRHAGLRVLRGPYTLAGQTFDAVYVSSTSAGARYHAAYDAASGLLVVHSGRAQGSAVPVIGGDGRVQAGAGGSLLTYGQLIGTMTMSAVPAPTPLPDAVARVSGLTYACTVTLAYPGTPPIQTPCRQDLEVVERAPHWLRLRVVRQTASTMGPIPDVVEAQDVLTAGGYGGVYASAPWLRALTSGTVLEEDAITGVRAWVDRADADAVVVVATAATQRLTYVYDPQSGWLTRLVLEQSTGPMTSVTQLDLQQMR
jgi:hypothetical protein